MKFQSLSHFPSVLIIITLQVVIVVPQASSSQYESYRNCARSFTCGTLSGIQYPFSRHDDPGYCGYPGFELDCKGRSSPTIDMNNMTYQVLSIDHSSQILKIIREDVMESICPHDFINTTINHNMFDYFLNYMNITFLYGCPDSLNLHGDTFSCDDNGIDKVLVLPGEQGPGVCNKSVIVPVSVMALGSSGLVNSSGLDQVLREGFEVRWKLDTMGCGQCTKSNGRCFYDYDTNRTSCACPGSPLIADSCNMANTGQSSSSSKNKSLTIVLPITGGILATIGIGSGLLFCRQRKKRRAAGANETPTKDSVTTVSTNSPTTTTETSTTITTSSTSTTTEIGNSTYFGTHVFTNDELEAATDGFNDSRELGDGGFGTVYYGKLIDGREVAVKRLYQNSLKRVEQFMNEVEILTMLNHENLVKFYGCTSRRSRELLLVYEYIANGTVADHLHGKLAGSSRLSWPLRLNIAIETAEALAYLHESDVIHRDVKTCNILLDNSFRVKVADFGLSRLFPINVTHVSTAPQGTLGYVDPEYYQCYQLTDKSDVYSFGVVLMELLSSLPAVDTSRHRLDVNLANMALDRIQNGRLGDLADKRIGFETDGLVRRVVTLVAELGFRCLQREKDMRPTMREVVESLRGIRNEELNVQKPEVVDIVVDDCSNPPSSDFVTIGKAVEG